MTQKKTEQLGMNPSTAAGRLVKDLLWSLIVETGRNVCCKCGTHMTRQDFSIEHVKPWLDAETPAELFFDLKNISYSHFKCNVAAARRPNAHTTPDAAKEARKAASRKWKAENRKYNSEERKVRYRKTGS